MKTMRANAPYYWTIITWEFTFWRTAIKGHSAYTTDIIACLGRRSKKVVEARKGCSIGAVADC
jgi:hypothetical protein